MSRATMFGCLMMLVLLFAVSCGDDDSTDSESGKVGTLIFTLNAEDFARDGFVSEDGWRIDFDHVYINIEGPTAYQVVEGDDEEPTARLMHAGHPHADIAEGQAHEALLGSYFIDGHQGEGPIELGRVDNAAIGNYNRLNFNISKAESDSEGLVEELEGYSIVLIGQAEKDGETLSFTIRLTEEMAYESCGPHHGDIGKVEEGGEGTAEATFHFDHIFGDADEGPADTDDEEAINFIAVGFGPFAELAEDGAIDLDQEDFAGEEFYDQFHEALLTLGHSGEAHCYLK